MAKPKPLPPVETLREYFSYDPETGIVTWTEQAAKTIRCVRAGKPAGRLSAEGYVQIAFKRKLYMAHRLIWKLKTGQEPSAQIDHKDRVRSNNRWCNLRKASHSLNQVNRTSCAKKRLPGVSPARIGGRFCAMGLGNRIYLGTFDTEQEAHDTYVNWHREHYGEFSVYAAPDASLDPDAGS